MSKDKSNTGKALAVLFDLDGVLADTMPGIDSVWQEEAARIGTAFGPLEVYRREGEKAEDTIYDLYLRAGRPAPDEAEMARVLARLRKRVLELGRPELFAVNVRIAEKIAQSGTKTALVTGSSLEHVKNTLPPELVASFSAIVTGQDVKNGKPAPEPYLSAAHKLGIEPEDCVVVENSPHGTTSAKAAGMRCIAFASTLPEEYLEKADAVVTTVEGLIRELGTAGVDTEFNIAYACTACGNCCLGKGDVVMKDEDIRQAAKFLDMDEREFINRFCRVSKYNSCLSLKNNADESACIFHEDMRCRIYPARPEQCRLFPNTWNYDGFEHICQSQRIIL